MGASGRFDRCDVCSSRRGAKNKNVETQTPSLDLTDMKVPHDDQHPNQHLSFTFHRLIPSPSCH